MSKDSNSDIQDSTVSLTAEQLIFSRLVAKGYSYTTAYRKAFPLKAKLSYGHIRVLAHELATNANIITEVETTKQRTAQLVRLAEDRLEDILVNDDTNFKGSRVADVAMFMYDHGNGKATQKVEHQGVFVNVQYDLSGGNAPAIPQDVLDALED